MERKWRRDSEQEDKTGVSERGEEWRIGKEIQKVGTEGYECEEQ